MTFRVGQKIAVIDGYVFKSPELTAETTPQQRVVYTIRAFDASGFGGLLLNEIRGGRYSDGTERGFYYTCFRPIVERKTDISIFTRMLIPQGVDA